MIKRAKFAVKTLIRSLPNGSGHVGVYLEKAMQSCTGENRTRHQQQSFYRVLLEMAQTVFKQTFFLFSRLGKSLKPRHRVLIPVQNAIARHVRLREPTNLYPVSQVNLQTVLKVKSSVVQIILPFLGFMSAGHVFTVCKI